MKSEYKKTYRPLVILVIVFFAVSFSLPYVLKSFGVSGNTITKATLLVPDLWLIALMGIIYKGQYVYWINGGPDFETAAESGEERRKRYAMAHLKRLCLFLIPLTIFLAVSWIFSFPFWIDITVFAVCVISAAISTVKINF